MAFLTSAAGTFVREGHRGAACAPKRLRAASGSRSGTQRARPLVMQGAWSPGQVVQVGNQELEDTLKEAGDRPLVVDFYAHWCGPCQVLAGELASLAKDYGDRLQVLKVDTEVEEDLATALVIRGLPTVMFVKGGKLLYRMEGAVPRATLGQIVDELFFGIVPENPEASVGTQGEASS